MKNPKGGKTGGEHRGGNFRDLKKTHFSILKLINFCKKSAEKPAAVNLSKQLEFSKNVSTNVDIISSKLEELKI